MVFHGWIVPFIAAGIVLSLVLTRSSVLQALLAPTQELTVYAPTSDGEECSGTALERYIWPETQSVTRSDHASGVQQDLASTGRPASPLRGTDIKLDLALAIATGRADSQGMEGSRLTTTCSDGDLLLRWVTGRDGGHPKTKLAVDERRTVEFRVPAKDIEFLSSGQCIALPEEAYEDSSSGSAAVHIRLRRETGEAVQLPPHLACVKDALGPSGLAVLAEAGTTQDGLETITARRLAVDNSNRATGVPLLFLSIGLFFAIVLSLHGYGRFLYKDPPPPPEQTSVQRASSSSKSD